jgi:methionyl-tRNA formyltransferase
VLDRVELPIGARATLGDLRRDLVEAGTAALVERLERGLDGATPQEGEVTYAAKIDSGELRIDWQRAAAEIDRLVRLGSAWTTFRGKRLKVLAATPVDGQGAAGVLLDPSTVAAWDGALRLDRVQPEGRGAMDASAWANGAHPQAGEVLGAPATDA